MLILYYSLPLEKDLGRRGRNVVIFYHQIQVLFHCIITGMYNNFKLERICFFLSVALGMIMTMIRAAILSNLSFESVKNYIRLKLLNKITSSTAQPHLIYLCNNCSMKTKGMFKK